MNLAEMSFQDKKKLAKELGLQVPRDTKGPELDRLIADAIPTAELEDASEAAVQPDYSTEFPKPLPFAHFFTVRSAGQGSDKRLERAKLKYARMLATCEMAKDFYDKTGQDFMRPPVLDEGASDEVRQLWRSAKRWFYTLAPIKITLTRAFYPGGKRVGPGKNIVITRNIRDYIKHTLSRKKTHMMKLVSGGTSGKYLDMFKEDGIH